MPYCFERYESVATAVNRIIGELTWTAARELHPGHPNYHAWVHNTRTSYKRVRSLLRLVRGSLGQSAYREEQSRIRGAANQLSGLRDAEVMVLSCDRLAESFAEHRAALGSVREFMLSRYQRITRIETNLQQKLLATAKELEDLTLRCADWSLPVGFDEPAANFARSYKRGRTELERVYREPGSDGFHEWRKRVKDHWHHCRLFDLAWPPAMMRRHTELKELADLLGEDHDLAVLQQVMAEEGNGADNLSGELARQRQQVLRERAGVLGQRIYADEPDVLAGQLRESLERWV